MCCKMAEHRREEQCPVCGMMCCQTFSSVATHDDHPLWLNDDVRNQIQGDDGPRIETRSQYRRYCRERNIVEVDRRVSPQKKLTYFC